MTKNHFTLSQNISLKDRQELVEANEKFLLGKTGFAFVDDHKGFRPGKIHILQARTSTGKTSIARSLFAKMSFDHKCLWYSSEETLEDWKIKTPEHSQPREDNVFLIEEHEAKKLYSTPREFLQMLEMTIDLKQIRFFVFDNITTTTFYNDLKPKEQSDFLGNLKSMIAKSNCAVLILAHVSSSCKTKLFQSDNVRGNKTLSNLAEYWYNMIRVVVKGEDSIQENITTLVHVEKSRAHDNSEQIYFLKYNRAQGYFADKQIDWKQMKNFLKDDLRST